MQVYLPDQLYEDVKLSGLPVSEILQAALRRRLYLEEKQNQIDEYLAELADDVGEPSAEERLAAERWAGG